MRLPAGSIATALAAVILTGLSGCDKSGSAHQNHQGQAPTTAHRSAKATSARRGPHGLVIGIKVDQYGTGHLDVRNYNYSGFDYDVAQYISEHVFTGDEPFYLPVSSATREDALKAGAIKFFVATYTIDQPREAKFEIAGPYLVTVQGVMVGPHSPVIRNVADLNGKTVCVVGQGSESEDILKEYAAGVRPVEAADYSDCTKELHDGNVQAMSTDQAILYGYLQQKGSTGLRVVPSLTLGNPIYYGIAFRKTDRQACLRTENTLIAMTRSDQWDNYFSADLPAYKAAVSNDQTQLKPTVQEIKQNSCVG